MNIDLMDALTTNWFLSIALAFGVIFAVAVLKRLVGNTGTILSSVPRNKVMLIGLPGAGKTVLFANLCGTGKYFSNDSNNSKPIGVKTFTSMEPNSGTAIEGGKAVVDYPGHQRLRHELYDELLRAQRLVIVIDSITVNDDKTEGAKELAGMLLPVLQSHAFHGVQAIQFACSKRDEITSFSSKAIRRILEAELTRAIVAQHGAIGALRGEVGKKIRKEAAAHSASAKDECLLQLDENGKFSFGSLSVPFTFVDCSVEDFDEVKAFCT